MAITQRDTRPTRAVVRYADVERTVPTAVLSGERQAFDVLSCGHTVPCRREPGGRLRDHSEPCGFCVAGPR